MKIYFCKHSNDAKNSAPLKVHIAYENQLAKKKYPRNSIIKKKKTQTKISSLIFFFRQKSRSHMKKYIKKIALWRKFWSSQILNQAAVVQLWFRRFPYFIYLIQFLVELFPFFFRKWELWTFSFRFSIFPDFFHANKSFKKIN